MAGSDARHAAGRQGQAEDATAVRWGSRVAGPSYSLSSLSQSQLQNRMLYKACAASTLPARLPTLLGCERRRPAPTLMQASSMWSAMLVVLLGGV